MNFESVLNYNNLCNNCKKSVKKIVLAIKKKYPAGIKDVEFEQIFFDPKVTMQKKIVPFVLIKHNNEFYGFFRHSDLRHLPSEAKQLLKQGRIILPASVLSVFKNRAIDVHKNARPPVKTLPKEITFSQTKYNSQ
ncbi:hypothetical protein [Spiroplasma endosymbiont of Stenodema calcarata]|uniref:hypothetical protein n=1 Tax=Spiroplasma endosymbiont of Stenodema calcarata TaxID=3139328 RepID=UPI003CCA8682